MSTHRPAPVRSSPVRSSPVRSSAAPARPGSPAVAVVGAGPAGLVLARQLQRHGVEVVVYDLDASATARDAGGTLDLHADSGQVALADADLAEAFAALARPEGQAKVRLDPQGRVLASFVPDAGDAAAPEIDRGQLRALLAEHVPPGVLRWGAKVVEVQPLAAGRHRLVLADGTTADADLVVGADGTWSRVRPLVTAARPVHTGICLVDVRWSDVDARHPALAGLVGPGHVFVPGGEGQGLVLQRNSDGVVRGYVGLRLEPDWPGRRGVDLADRTQVRTFLRSRFEGWAPVLVDALVTSESYVNRPVWVLPDALTWEHVPGVTLVGDAAHVMAPFGGWGVNHALLDGVELAAAVVGPGRREGSLDERVAAYERAMFARTGPLSGQANGALQEFFSAAPGDAPDHRAEHEAYEEAAAALRRERAGASA